MLTLPDAIVAVLVPFATLFTSPTWQKAQLLLVGAVLTPGQRTVAAALRVMGRNDQRDYSRYHEVLNRAVWSSRAVARVLLALLLQRVTANAGGTGVLKLSELPSACPWRRAGGNYPVPNFSPQTYLRLAVGQSTEALMQRFGANPVSTRSM